MADVVSQMDPLTTYTPPDASQPVETQSLPSPPPNTPPPQTQNPTPTKRRVEFWVSPPPSIPTPDKINYKELSPSDIPQESEEEDDSPMEILNEIRLGTDVFYWVKSSNDIIYRHLAKDFKKEYPNLVADYKQRQDEGLVEAVDPKSSAIFPKDRVEFIGKGIVKTRPPDTRAKRVTATRKASTEKSAIIKSADDETEESEDDYDSDDGRKKAKKTSVDPSRRSSRNTERKTYRDPSPSPAKKRSNPRRGARTEDDDVYMDVEEDEEDDFEDSIQPRDSSQTKKKKVVRKRLSRPAYGNIRPIADLSDYESDDEDALLHAHRPACEKCQQLAAHDLLNKMYNRGQKKKRTRQLDEFEESDDEEARLQGLGGWVRCLKCCVTVHWKCLPKVQRDEIMKAARAKDAESTKDPSKLIKRSTLDAYETTDFYCSGCMTGGICMYCEKTAVEPQSLPALKETTEDAPEKPKDADHPMADANPGAKQTTPAPPDIIIVAATPRQNEETSPKDETALAAAPKEASGEPDKLLFRCVTCKRLAHYDHLPPPDDDGEYSPGELARHYQSKDCGWNCSDCQSFVHSVDKIIAWRPYPANAVEPALAPGEVPDYKARLPREYLIKWVDRSYRRVQWVPHMWLVSTAGAKLKNFLATGTRVHLLDAPVEDTTAQDTLSVESKSKEATPAFLAVDDASRASTRPESAVANDDSPSPPLPDAEKRIPPAWRTVDRILDVRLFDPKKKVRASLKKKAKAKGKAKSGGRSKQIESESEAELDAEEEAEAEAERIAAMGDGEEPSEDYLETIDEWEERTGEAISTEQAKDVIWAYIKWDDLSYEDASWDSPPAESESGYAAFEKAFKRFIETRDLTIDVRSGKAARDFDDRRKGQLKALTLETDPDLGQTGKLMDFQLTGVNWLFRNWWTHQPSILADEMGLGKTVQITTLVGHLAESFKASPVLIVVPNSTITNWLREFARWAPRLRIVPYYGEAKSREVIRKYEMYHDEAPKGHSDLKFHVLVTTYENMTGRDFSTVFKRVGRWELLIVDEGQRLKSDSSLLFKRMNELNAVHRILMTGTPLNNNIRELFNLMNFLDADNWQDLQALEKEHEVLTEELLLKLHERLKPYFLRRTKADVLKLPPKNEVIVPVSMTAIQKEVYKGILSQNVEILGSLTQPNSRVSNAIKKSNLNNILMQLRKCLQHPYLVSRELEPTGAELTPESIHKNLVDASTKLKLLHNMLPKLKARGHRVLLFSQFTMALDIIEDFLVGEGYKFLRLDGNVKQDQRQKDMDTFNRSDSDVFIYLLSTRAGGVGINLWSADTVIIFDPDFNPHQDLQAISRAHRYGQTRTVLVFKLMVKGAAEERIVQTGKKKLALDHLIVQKMDEDSVSDDVQSILTFGAKAIFDNDENNDIHYSDADIEKLIERTEKEGDQVQETQDKSSSFGFAKLWVVEKDVMEEVAEDAPADAQEGGFWDEMLARAAAEKAKKKAAEVTGRGAKRRAAALVQTYTYDDGSPEKPVQKKRRKSRDESDMEDITYNISDNSEDGRSSVPTHSPGLISDDDILTPRQPFQQPSHPVHDLSNPFLPALSMPTHPSKKLGDEKPKGHKTALASIENQRENKKRTAEDSDDERLCGLCHTSHGPGECYMTQNATNLVEYRAMLFTVSTEPLETRRRAVQAIDKHLASRGLSHLTKGQMFSFPTSEKGSQEARKKKPKVKDAGETLKRPSSPTAESSQSGKKQKTSDAGSEKCPICEGSFHLVKKCPIVKLGPDSIESAIRRLAEDTTNNASTINILQSILQRQSS